MKTRNKNLKRILPIVIISILLGSIVSAFAVPLLPMSVIGDVYVDDVLAGAGLNVYAKHETTTVAEATTNALGHYVLSITEASGLEDGDPIDFYVGTEDTGETAPMEYGNIPLELDLYIAGEAPPAENVAPVADAGGPYEDEEGVAISFDGSGSSDSDGTIESYAWTFGDGGTGTGVGPDHAYTDAGEYTVTLTVTDDDGATDIDSTTATITDPVEDDDDDDDDVEPDIPDPTDEFSIDYVSADTGDKGDTLTVIGSGVTAGTTVNVYWDFASGTSIHLLNTTEGDPDGTFELEIDVPSDTVGPHYLWATDVSTGETVSWGTFTMVPKLSLSPSSGLVDDEITISGYGYTDEANLTFTIGSANLTVSPSDVETDEDGYFTVTFDVPDDVYATYVITVTDFYDVTESANFVLGASITLTPEEGPTGAVVVVAGRGWTEDANITFTLGGITVQVVDDDVVTVDDDGEFSVDVVIPDMGTEDEYSLNATETGSAKGPASEDFEVVGLPEFEVSPTYGAPGATITVTGSNFTQIAGTEVTITLDSSPVSSLVTAETEADGTFTATFTSPAVAFETYTVTAVDEYSIDEDDAYKVGLIALIINPISGESGTRIAMTGIGFTAGLYNVTFGDDLYEDFGTVVGEALSDNFYAPNVAPGIYTILIIDQDENELSVQFSVTAASTVSIDPVVAPNDYNVSISGDNFADVEDGELTFEIYNTTEDWSLVMTVVTDPAGLATVTDDDGNFTGYWMVPADDELSLGDYTINITDSQDLLVQLSYSVVVARVDVASRKALYDSGDTVAFDISNDFDLPGSYIEIYSPDETLYWITEDFTGVWVLVDDLYTVPYYRQTANMNLMELQNDAPVGTWTYFFYDVDDDELMNGTFAVGPSTAAQVDAMLDDVRSDLSDLALDIAAINNDDIEDDISDLAQDIAGVISDVDNLRDDIVSDLADDIAAATDAGKEASDAVDDLESSLSDLEDAVGDIATISNDALDAAQNAADAADTAASAAEDAGKAASGLTGLVYGAIGASLIAALAAIVSLMQISKKIAG